LHDDPRLVLAGRRVPKPQGPRLVRQRRIGEIVPQIAAGGSGQKNRGKGQRQAGWATFHVLNSGEIL